MKKFKKAFTLLELIVTLAVSSILLVTLTSFLVFTNNISTDYRFRANTVHSAYNMMNTIKSYIDKDNNGKLTISTFNSKLSNGKLTTPTDSYKLLTYNPGTLEETYTIYYQLPDTTIEKDYPKLLIQYGNSEVIDTIFVAKSNITIVVTASDITLNSISYTKTNFTLNYPKDNKSEDVSTINFCKYILK